MVRTPPITFRPLHVDDFAVVHAWLCRPHVARWWMPTPTRAELDADLVRLTDAASPVRGYLAFVDGRPLGFVQSYVVRDSGGGWWEDETDPGARGIDLFLADENDVGRGLGRAMVRAFVERLFDDPAVTRVQTDPSPDNARAMRSFQAAGFIAQAQVLAPDGPAVLMVIRRHDLE